VMEQMKLDGVLQKIPVILLTNLDSEKDTGLAMGAVDYVVKADTSIDELVAKVKKHIG
jgi:DNA-binding response OmpR family regulator